MFLGVEITLREWMLLLEGDFKGSFMTNSQIKIPITNDAEMVQYHGLE
jgi:hypothetical protein